MSGTGERIEPAAATVPLPGAVVEGQAPPAAAATPPPAPAAAASEDWRDKRLGQLSARLHERNDVVTTKEARIAELEAQIASLQPRAAAAAAAPTEEEIAQRVRAEAERLAPTLASQQTATIEFNRQCNAAVEAGRLQFADFDSKLGDLRSVITPGDQASEGAYWGIVSAALKSGKAAKVIHALGSDRAEAMRIMALDPESRTIEIAKMAMQGASADGDEGLPKPIVPLGSKGAQHTAIDPTDTEKADRLSTAEWMKRRAAQVEKRA